MSEYHTSVLLSEALNFLLIEKGKQYIDATLGGGGHTIAIAKLGGSVLSLDIDEDALTYVESLTKSLDQKVNERIHLVKGNFAKIDEIAKEQGVPQISGILFDLGVSSHQFDEGTRGFSFRVDAPLDMRMDQDLEVKAADLINGLTKGELIELFTKLGEEYLAKKIAQRIIETRELTPITTTRELAEIAERAYPRGYHKTHPATKIFQALRIAVNDELNSLYVALPKALTLLVANGRIVVISFHSLEDRIVKETFLQFEKEGKGKIITDKPIEAGEAETIHNPRSRSAKLRVFEKI